MEVEKENLLKLKKLEKQLLDAIEQVDKEINQVDVEWLNLRSIALKQMQDNQPQNVPNTTSQKPLPPVKKEYKDSDFHLMDINLELNPRVNQPIDEEFDSD